MTILAIETATASVGCALWADGAPLAAFVLVAPQRHAEVLMPAIDDMCRKAAVAVSDLDGVAVDVGPGLFTGLRVGLATARAIATARHLPAAGVTSLEALAHPHRRRQGLVAAVVDARRGEVFSAIYSGGGELLRERRAAAVSSPESLAAELSAFTERPLAVGDGAWRYRDVLGAGSEVAGPADLAPSPLVVAELGSARLGAPFPPALYLRQADVRIGWEEVGGRVRGPGAPAPVPPGPVARGPVPPPVATTGSSPARPKLGS
jgi:tRNA threonylcarbamoyladenosine biosynthesis protein TsaB